MTRPYVYQTVGERLSGGQTADEFTALVRSEVPGAFRERSFFVALEDKHALERLCSEIAIAEGIKDGGVVLIAARARSTGRTISSTSDLRRVAKNGGSGDGVRFSYRRDKAAVPHAHHSTLPPAPETSRVRLARETSARQASMQKKISSAVGSARDCNEKTFKERICSRLAESATAPGAGRVALVTRARDLLLAEKDSWYTTPAMPAEYVAGLIGKDLVRTVASLDPTAVKTARANNTLQRAYSANLERSEGWNALEFYRAIGQEMHQEKIDARHGGPGRGHGGPGRGHGHGGPGRVVVRGPRHPRFYGGRSLRGWGWRNGVYVDLDLYADEYDIYGRPIVYAQQPGFSPVVYATPPPRPLLSFGAELKPTQPVAARYYAGGYYPGYPGYGYGYGYPQPVVAAPQPVVYQPYAPAVVVGGYRRPRPLISIGGGRRRGGLINLGDELADDDTKRVEAKMGGMRKEPRTSTGRWTTSRERRASGASRRGKTPPRDPKNGEFESKREHAAHGSHHGGAGHRQARDERTGEYERTNAPIASHMTGKLTPAEKEENRRWKEEHGGVDNRRFLTAPHKKEKKEKKNKKDKKGGSRMAKPASAAAASEDDGWTMPTQVQSKPVSDIKFTPYQPAASGASAAIPGKYPIAARVVATEPAAASSQYVEYDSEDDMPLVAAAQPKAPARAQSEPADDWSPTVVPTQVLTPAGQARVRITNLAYADGKRVQLLYVTVSRDGGQEKSIGDAILYGTNTTRQLPLGPKYTFRFYAGRAGTNEGASPIKTIEESFGKDGLYSITIRTEADKNTKFRMRTRSIPGLFKNARASLVRSELSVPVIMTNAANIPFAIGAELSELLPGAYTMSMGGRNMHVTVHPEIEYSVKLSGGNTVVLVPEEDNALAKMERHNLANLQPIANSVIFVRDGQDLLVAPLASFKTTNSPTDDYHIAVSKATAPAKPIGSMLMNPSNAGAWSATDDLAKVHDVFTHPANSSTLVVVVAPHEIHQ